VQKSGSGELNRAAWKCTDCREDGIPGKEDENGRDDCAAVKRDEQSSESLQR